MKKHLKNITIAVVSTLLIIAIVFFLKGIYPFGPEEYSIIDFDSGYVPVYYNLWDLFHGQGSFIFDWNLGGGLYVFGSLVMNGLIVPTSWVIALFSRGFIPYAISFVLILKILTITVTTYVSLNKLFPKLEDKYKVLLSVVYTLSGWTLIMMSSLLYIDAVALFPLFVYAFYNFMKNGKWIMYMVVLTLVLMISYYMAYMYLFFIVGATIACMIFLDVKDKKKKSVLIVIMTLSSLVLSSILFLPSFYQTLTSYRMSSSYETVATPLTTFYNKIIHLFPMGLLFVLTAKELLKVKNKKLNLWIIFMLVYTLIGVFVEPINLMWHTGSHTSLPFRYSYIPMFIMLIASANYLEKEEEEYVHNRKNFICSIIMIVMFCIMSLLLKDGIMIGQIALNIIDYSQILGLLILFIISVATFTMILKNDSKTKKVLLIIFTSINILSFSYLYIINDKMNSSSRSEEISNEINIIADNYNYSSTNVDESIIGMNSPYIIKRPSLINRLHFIKEYEINYRDAFNYRAAGTTIVTTLGGNIISDAISLNKYVFSTANLNPILYDYQKSVKEVNYYISKYNLSLLIPYKGNIYNELGPDMIANTNSVYKVIFGYDEDIIKELKSEGETITFYPGYMYYTFSNKKDTPVGLEDAISQKIIYNNDIFMNEFYTNDIIAVNSNSLDDYDTYYIDIDDYIEFVNAHSLPNITVSSKEEKRTYELTIEEDTKILIPVNYDEAFKIYVNGKEVEYERNLYNMFSINLSKGHNRIELVYKPKLIIEGILITTVMLLLIIAIAFINKKARFLEKKIILYPLFALTIAIGIAFILKMYILPLL